MAKVMIQKTDAYRSPGSASAKLSAAAQRALPGGNSRTTIYMAEPIYAAHADGCWVTDVDGDRSRVRRVLDYMSRADPALLRSPRLLAASTLMQGAVIAADTATLWALVRSLGASLPPNLVFGSFMLSSVFRSVAFSPGGLGAFEASSVYTLKRAGLPLAVAFSATLLFRGLSFWLPMLPGLWATRRELKGAPSPASASSDTDPPARA